MTVCVTGSLAFDHIMVFQDEFQKHILPDKVHMLSVCFAVDTLETAFGGTAGNIAYTMAQLGTPVEIVATIGSDGRPYLDYLHQQGIGIDAVLLLEECKTAQAFITTDQKANQIAAFYSGAMAHASRQHLDVLINPPKLVLISPNDPSVMLNHAEYCRDQNWSFWADPGQAMPAFDADPLMSLITNAKGLFVNDYEWSLFLEKTGSTLTEILQICPLVIETTGAKGLLLHTEDGTQSISAYPDALLVDPTGAGDAFRAGVIHALEKGLEIADACRYACAVASFAVEQKGTQSHQIDLSAVQERYAILSSL